MVECEPLVFGVSAQTAPNQNIDTLLEQYNLLLRIGVKPIEGENHIICHRPRDQNKVADALAGAASEGSLGLVWGWDFAALRALGRVWGEGGSHWVVRGFCDGSYLKATEAAPARAGAGGQIIVHVFDKLAELPYPVPNLSVWRTDAARRRGQLRCRSARFRNPDESFR